MQTANDDDIRDADWDPAEELDDESKTWTMWKKKNMMRGGAGRVGWGSGRFGTAYCERNRWKKATHICTAVGGEQGTSATPGSYYWSGRWK